MLGVSSYDSSSISTLFSSLGSSSGSNFLGINLTDYKCIQNGSYGKLLRAYYSKQDTDSTSSTTNKTTTSTSSDTTKTLANIESDAEELTESAQALYERSGNKVFKKDASGNYDTDKIYSAVSDFVTDYNDLVSSAADSKTSRIKTAVSAMKTATSSNESALNELGITVDSTSGKLTLDETKFKSADMSKAKSLFYGNNSYAYSVATQSSLVDSYASSEASKSNTYSSSGKYSYNYNSGDLFSASF